MFATVFNDLIVLFCFLIVGFILRELIKPLQNCLFPHPCWAVWWH